MRLKSFCTAYGARLRAPEWRSEPFAGSATSWNQIAVRTPDSLRSQLVVWTMLPMLAVLMVSAIATYFIAFSVANRAYDYSLQDEARTIAARVHLDQDVPLVSLPPEVREVLEYDPLDKVYFDVWSRRFGLLTGHTV